jgi:hypothetical protein
VLLWQFGLPFSEAACLCFMFSVLLNFCHSNQL